MYTCPKGQYMIMLMSGDGVVTHNNILISYRSCCIQPDFSYLRTHPPSPISLPLWHIQLTHTPIIVKMLSSILIGEGGTNNK